MKSATQPTPVATTAGSPLRKGHHNVVNVRGKSGTNIGLVSSASQMLQQLLLAAGFAGQTFSFVGVTPAQAHQQSNVVRVGNPSAHGVEITVCHKAHEGFVGKISGGGVNVTELHSKLKGRCNVGKNLFDCGVADKAAAEIASPSTPEFTVIPGGLSPTDVPEDEVILGILSDTEAMSLAVVHLHESFGDDPFPSIDGASILGILCGHPIKTPTALVAVFQPLFTRFVELRWLTSTDEGASYKLTPSAKKIDGASRPPVHQPVQSAPAANPDQANVDAILARLETLRRLKREYDEALKREGTLRQEAERLGGENTSDEARVQQIQREAEQQTRLLREKIQTRRNEVLRLNAQTRELEGILHNAEYIKAGEELAKIQSLLAGAKG